MVEVELAWEQAKTGYNAIGAITRPSKAEHIENLKPEKWEDPNYWGKWKSESISLDKELNTMYSFGRLKAYNPLHGGFVHEHVHSGTFKRFYKTKSMICEKWKEGISPWRSWTSFLPWPWPWPSFSPWP